jgi:hypothetical protein
VAEIAAIPTFLSPFEWRIVVQMADAYEVYGLNVLDPPARPTTNARQHAPAEMPPRQPEHLRVRPAAERLPNGWTAAALEAARSPAARVFLGFSRFPVVSTRPGPDGSVVVRWTDVRFGAPTSGPEQAPPPGLFTVSVRLGRDGRVVEQGLGN